MPAYGGGKQCWARLTKSRTCREAAVVLPKTLARPKPAELPMSELQDFVRKKREELQAQVAPLIARREQLEAEIQSLTDTIDKVLPDLEELDKTASYLGIEPSNTPLSSEARSNKVTIKQGVRLVLYIFKDGLNSAHLHEQVSRAFYGGKLDRTSFSPQLSRMRKDGELELADTVWTLTPHGAAIMGEPNDYTLDLFRGSKENEPSDAGASDGSDAALDTQHMI